MKEQEGWSADSDRRGFLGWVGRLGVVAVGAIAGAGVLERPADAYTYHCCTLARPPGGCPGSGSGFTCPSGYYRRVWGCCRSDGRYVFCGECTTGSTCHTGSFYCSEGWVSGNVC